MRLTVPIVVQSTLDPGYVARPLFFAEPAVYAQKAQRAVHRLEGELWHLLRGLGDLDRHDELAAWSYCPDLDDRLLDVDIRLRKRSVTTRLLLVTLQAVGRTLAFCPAFPTLWFDVRPTETLAGRASDVLSRMFRDNDDTSPEAFAVPRDAWVTPVSLNIDLPTARRKRAEERRAELFGERPAHGAAELRRVGRCLDWQYPDDLARVVARDAEPLERLLQASDRRPVVLLGPSLAGKTALVHEAVWRRMHARKGRQNEPGQVWHLSPPRLVSGMSFVGQWERRLLAILEHTEKQDHILYFDDFLGLFTAGTHRHSDLSMAHVLKPYLWDGRIRLLAEMTHEAWHRLQEQDRGLADLFATLPVPPLGERDTRQVGLSLVRTLEARHGCRFDLDALPAAIDVERRFDRGAAFPGKLAVLLSQLAMRHARQDVGRSQVLQQFQARSGLSLAFVDDTQPLSRDDLLRALQAQVAGQAEAVRVVLDILVLAKARLNDVERPLGSLLFLGPTGVGKTHLARQVAATLYGSDERLLRFDMNEFSDARSVARLVGTLWEPEGLLTAAVRRQPFAVLLLDEIEKAHPDVFNLLLQVMGDGRLTDALGRTADFSEVLLIMTSNLGATEVARPVGLRARDEEAEAVTWRRAAERFFSPEFYNRLDGVVPFHRLGPDEVVHICRHAVDAVFRREGLTRRQCILDVDPAALVRLAEAACDPAMGARALKRTIERQLTDPIASRLAVLPGDTPTLVFVGPDLQTTVTALQQPPAEPQLFDVVSNTPQVRLLKAVEAALARIDLSLTAAAPGDRLEAEALGVDDYRYLAQREAWRRLVRWQESQAEAVGRPVTRRPGKKPLRKPVLYQRDWALPTRDLVGGLRRLEPSAEWDRLAGLVAEVAWLDSAGPALTLEVQGGSRAAWLRTLYLALVGDLLDITPDLRVDGPGAALLQAEAGVHLFCTPAGRLEVVRVQIVDRPLPPTLVRVYDADSFTLDLRSGWMVEKLPGAAELRALLTTNLPLSPEVLACR